MKNEVSSTPPAPFFSWVLDFLSPDEELFAVPFWHFASSSAFCWRFLTDSSDGIFNRQTQSRRNCDEIDGKKSRTSPNEICHPVTEIEIESDTVAGSVLPVRWINFFKKIPEFLKPIGNQILKNWNFSNAWKRKIEESIWALKFFEFRIIIRHVEALTAARLVLKKAATISGVDYFQDGGAHRSIFGVVIKKIGRNQSRYWCRIVRIVHKWYSRRGGHSARR